MAGKSFKRVSTAEPGVVPSTSRGGTSFAGGVPAKVNENTACFLQDADVSVAEVSGDVTSVADALAYHLANRQTPDGGKE